MTRDKMFHAHDAARLDDPARRRHLPVDRLVAMVGPRPGETIADIGVGLGLCLLPIVEALRGEGRFLAVDCQEEMLARFREKIAAFPYAEAIETVLTPPDRLRLPAASLDAATLGSVYHELPDRQAYCAEIHRALKPGGRVIICDWRPLRPDEDREAGPPNDHRVAVAQAARELAAAGFVDPQIDETLPAMWILTAFRKKPEKS